MAYTRFINVYYVFYVFLLFIISIITKYKSNKLSKMIKKGGLRLESDGSGKSPPPLDETYRRK